MDDEGGSFTYEIGHATIAIAIFVAAMWLTYKAIPLVPKRWQMLVGIVVFIGSMFIMVMLVPR